MVVCDQEPAAVCPDPDEEDAAGWGPGSVGGLSPAHGRGSTQGQ